MAYRIASTGQKGLRTIIRDDLHGSTTVGTLEGKHGAYRIMIPQPWRSRPGYRIVESLRTLGEAMLVVEEHCGDLGERQARAYAREAMA
jgi:hypothetical protein